MEPNDLDFQQAPSGDSDTEVKKAFFKIHWLKKKKKSAGHLI